MRLHSNDDLLSHTVITRQKSAEKFKTSTCSSTIRMRRARVSKRSGARVRPEAACHAGGGLRGNPMIVLVHIGAGVSQRLWIVPVREVKTPRETKLPCRTTTNARSRAASSFPHPPLFNGSPVLFTTELWTELASVNGRHLALSLLRTRPSSHFEDLPLRGGRCEEGRAPHQPPPSRRSSRRLVRPRAPSSAASLFFSTHPPYLLIK